MENPRHSLVEEHSPHLPPAGWLAPRDGHPLPPDLLHRLSALFETPLDSVRLHHGPLASRLGARAVTWGEHIHFAPGQYDPTSARGLQLLCHELAHVLQQRAALLPRQPGPAQLAVAPALEAMAELVGWLATTALLAPSTRQPHLRPGLLRRHFPWLWRRLQSPLDPTLALQPMLIQQASFASGDMFSIAAAMLVDPSVDVAIVLQKQDADEDGLEKQLQKARAIKGYYDEVVKGYYDRQTGAVVRRPRYEIVESQENFEQVKKEWGYGLTDRPHREDKATEILGQWNGEYRRIIREAMLDGGVSGEACRLLSEWLLHRQIDGYQGRRVVVLWSRLSGKKGEIHLEHDTSYFGIFQLCIAALRCNDMVFIAGDPPYNPKGKLYRDSRYDDIVTIVNFLAHHERLHLHYSTVQQVCLLNKKLLGAIDTSQITFNQLSNHIKKLPTTDSPGRAANITGFWQGNDPRRDKWCTSRVAQFQLYDYLQEVCSEVKHLGFRSGNLEALALLGYTVRYMEEPFSVGAHRMAQWHGKSIGYERIIVEQVPTRSGQHLVKARMAVIQGEEEKTKQNINKFFPNGKLVEKGTNLPVRRLQRAAEILQLLGQKALPRDLQPYFYQARRVVVALGQGTPADQLPKLPKPPDNLNGYENSPFYSQYPQLIRELNQLLDAQSGITESKQVAQLLSNALTKERQKLAYISRREVGKVQLTKDLKRVEWIPEKRARLGEEAKPKPDVSELTSGFLESDLLNISEFLASRTPPRLL